MLNSYKSSNEKIEPYLTTNTSASEDIKEALIVYKNIKLHMGLEGNLILEDCFVNPFLNINFKFNRLLELRYKSHFNYEILRGLMKDICECHEAVFTIGASNRTEAGLFKIDNQITGENQNGQIVSKVYPFYIITDDIIETLFKKSNNQFENFKKLENFSKYQNLNILFYQEKFEDLITDSIFCFYEMIKSLNIYGISYLHNHSWLGSCYMKLGEWAELYNAYLKKMGNPKGSRIKKNLENLIEQVEINEISNPKSLYERALRHYYSLLEMHSEGGAYKEVLEKMYYLDDNFNDNLYHFCAALERFQINNNSISINITKLEKRVEGNEVYKTSYYFQSEP